MSVSYAGCGEAVVERHEKPDGEGRIAAATTPPRTRPAMTCSVFRVVRARDADQRE